MGFISPKRGVVPSAAAIALMVLPFGFLAQPALAGPPPDLSGKWKFNQDKSDDAREKVREAMANSNSRRGMGGSGMGWPGRQGGGGGGMGTPPFGGGAPPYGGNGGSGGQTGQGGGNQTGDQAQPTGNMAALLDPPEELDIAQKDPVLTINKPQSGDQPQSQNTSQGQTQSQPDTENHTIYTDGRKMEQQNAQGEKRQSTAKWKDGKLVVETKGERGKLTETYELAQGGKELDVTLKVESGRFSGQSVTVRRVYELDVAKTQ
jgi:hypothetical protein